MIDRRELIGRAAAVLGGTISAGTALGVLSGCVATPDEQVAAGAAGKFLTAEELQNVTVLSEQIIPRTDTPGAIDVGIPAFIDRMLADFYEEPQQQIIRAGLARVESDARTQHGKSFASLSSDQQIALMRVYDREAYNQARDGSVSEPHFFRLIKELTTLGYFTSEPGATEFLRYEPIPGPYRGDIPYSEIGKAWAL